MFLRQPEPAMAATAQPVSLRVVRARLRDYRCSMPYQVDRPAVQKSNAPAERSNYAGGNKEKEKTMNDMIEKLKDKDYVRAFGLMSPEERECLKKVGKENCLCFHGGQWGDPYRSNACFNYQFTYAIKPDYKPEPEVIDVPIVKNGNWLGCWQDDVRIYLPHGFTHLHCLPSLPGFHCFWFKEGNYEQNINFSSVSRKAEEGETVYAKFRSRK